LVGYPTDRGLIFRFKRLCADFRKFVILHGGVRCSDNNCLAGSHGRSPRANANIAKSTRWGRGAVGSAPRWHRGGRGFESHRLHHLKNSKNLPQKTANCYQVLLPALHFPLAFKHESFTLCEENGYGHYTLIARINAGDGKFPFVNVQFSKNP
jgi:hypothetical protein